MKAITIEDMINSKPFKPFTIRMDNGQIIKVPHGDFIFLSPGKTTAVVFEGEHLQIVDIEHVSSITTTHKKQKATR